MESAVLVTYFTCPFFLALCDFQHKAILELGPDEGNQWMLWITVFIPAHNAGKIPVFSLTRVAFLFLLSFSEQQSTQCYYVKTFSLEISPFFFSLHLLSCSVVLCNHCNFSFLSPFRLIL